jgi:uncharacterized protein Veg
MHNLLHDREQQLKHKSKIVRMWKWNNKKISNISHFNNYLMGMSLTLTNHALLNCHVGMVFELLDERGRESEKERIFVSCQQQQSVFIFTLPNQLLNIQRMC